MKFQNDPLLPLLQKEMDQRIAHFKGLSADDESKLLSLNQEQKRVIADLDRKSKQDYLATLPNINNPGVKSHEKYKNFAEIINNFHKSDVKA